MTIREKIRAVEQVFNELEIEQNRFRSQTKLGCATGCGKCCFKADIEATALEFLPFAYHVFKAGKSVEWLTQLEENNSPVCLLIKPFLDQEHNGMCSQYPHRGLICRLFGFSGRVNKYGSRELVTCQIIKSGQVEDVQAANQMVQKGGKIPLMNNYYMKLHAIDPDLARQHYPINLAIRKAIEVVLHYFSYRSRRSA